MSGCGGHLGHVISTIGINFGHPIIRILHMKFEFKWPRGSEEIMF